MDILTHYTSHLGKFVLFNDKEIRLESIHQSYIAGLNGNKEPELMKPDDCKLIFDNEREYYRSCAPYFISVIRSDDGYTEAAKIKPEPPEETEKQIVEAICKCSQTNEEGLKQRTRKREIVQGRQIHMTLRKKLIFPEDSLQTTANIYYQEHATVINSIKKVTNSLESNYDVEFRERFRRVWELVKLKYPKQDKFNLSWL